MGCITSKQVVEAADVYCPPPASIAYFDIDKVVEPWLVAKVREEKPSHLHLPVLEKDDGGNIAPKPWSEVSKALEDLKPTLQHPVTARNTQPSPPATAVNGSSTVAKLRVVKKNQTFHMPGGIDRAKTMKKDRTGATFLVDAGGATMPEGLRPVSQNSFFLGDRQEREKRNSTTEDPTRSRDALQGFPEICPPGGTEDIVLYTTTVRAVRRTFEDCEAVRQIVEGHLLGEVDIDERDISLHGQYLKELRELVGEEASMPRLFILGRYVGGVKEINELNEIGRLGAITRMARRRRSRRRTGGGGAAEVVPSPTGRKGCKGCGGVRFVPCLVCNGSCKVVAAGDEKTVVRCGECNENGLIKCPRCKYVRAGHNLAKANDMTCV